MTWIGPRVTMTMGEDIPLLRPFSRKSKNDAPTVAIVFQLLIADLLLLTQSFEAVLDFIQFSLAFCSFFTVLGLIKMRITHPELARPYRAWGYPVTPLIFLGVTLFMMYYLVVNRPLQSLAGVAMMLAGLVIYYVSRPSSSNVSRFGRFPNCGLNNVLAPAEIDAATLMAASLALPLAGAQRRGVTGRYGAIPRRTTGGAGSPLAALTKDALWREHAHYFNSIFGREDAKLSKVRAFAKDHLTDKHDTLLYLFSGPDFLYATTFFPNASTYVLAGLEPAGDIPQLTSLSRPPSRRRCTTSKTRWARSSATASSSPRT